MPIELLPLDRGDRDAILRLFAEYPFKSRQKEVQRIDPARLAGLLWDMVDSHLDRPDSAAWVAWRRKTREAVGFGLVAPHSWHSKVFGRPMGRIEHLVNYVEPETVGPRLIEALVEGARKGGIEHLACRIDGHDWPNVHLLESHGFRCVDCSLKMARSLEDFPKETPAPLPGGLCVRPFDPADLEAIQQIATRSHEYNHFYNDPGLGRDRAQQLFRQWIARCATRLADFVLVAQDPDDRLIGFVTALHNAALGRVVGVRVGIIDYIVVDRDLAGRGVGRALLDRALGRLASEHDWAELRTSHDNYRAVSFYNAAGFRTVASDFVFHRWEIGSAPS